MSKIELQERVYASEYLEELKESIRKIFEENNVKYFRNRNGMMLFYDSRNNVRIRAFYASEERYVSFDLWGKSSFLAEKQELITIYLRGFQNELLWANGTYFEYVIKKILRLFKGTIKVDN